MSTPEIAVTNAVPHLYSDAECQMLVDACAAALPGFCKEWGYALPTVAYYPDRSKVPATSWEVALLDQPPADSKGVEAYHEDPNGVPDGKCFAGFLLSQGGQKWTGELAVSVAYTHEVFEAIRNPRTNLVLQNPPTAPDGKTYATLWAEVGDPAQGEHFEWSISGTTVWTAGYVTQSWEDPHGKPPYSLPANIVPGPLRIGEQGYGGFGDEAGNVATIFAAKCHPVLQALKQQHGRLAEVAKARALQGVMAKIHGAGEPGAALRGDVKLPVTTLLVDGVECPVAAFLGDKRAIVAISEGVYLAVDQAPDGTWGDSGTPATGDEMAILKKLVDATPDTVTVTKDTVPMAAKAPPDLEGLRAYHAVGLHAYYGVLAASLSDEQVTQYIEKKRNGWKNCMVPS